MKLSLYRLKALAWKGFVAVVAFSFVMAIRNAYFSTDHQLKFPSGSKKNLSVMSTKENNANVFNIASKVAEAIENLEHTFEESDEEDIHPHEEMAGHPYENKIGDNNKVKSRLTTNFVALTTENIPEEHDEMDKGLDLNKDERFNTERRENDKDHSATNDDHSGTNAEDHSFNKDKGHSVVNNEYYGVNKHEDHGVAKDQNHGVSENEDYGVNKNEVYGIANIDNSGVNEDNDHGVANDENYGINKNEGYGFADNEYQKVIIDEDHSVNNDKEVKEALIVNKFPDSTVNRPQSSGENFDKNTSENFIYDEVLNYRNKSTRSMYISGHQYPNKDLCPNDGKDIEAIIVIPTSQWLRRRRDPIRKTWGKVESNTKIVVAFLSGKPNSAAREMDLKKEMDEFGDIIVDSMEDSYTNLPLKIISILEWVSLYCSKATYLMKADDDVFVNTELLKEFIQENKVKTDTIFGRYIRKPWPSRITSRKFYVTREEYPGGSYPAYVTGPSYLVPVPAAKEIFLKSLTMPYFRYEDIFLMGMVADRIHIKREHSHKFCLARSLEPKPCYANQCIAVHNIKDNLQFTLWESKINNDQC